jgi:RecA-family ATPase|tara:strand:- start:600 stop:1415 length:816 start_codon:yes stop_codon:yes gene_type:complete
MELIKKEVQHVVPDESLKFLNDVLSKRIKSSDSIKESEYLLRIGAVNKFSKGNISGWIGLAKSKKTFALTMFVSALVGGLKLFDTFNANTSATVLYIDTEQSPADVQKITRRVKKMVGNEDKLFMYGLRPLSPKQRIKAIQILLEKHKVDVLVIDGVRDLLMDINNAVESTEVMTLLMRWSFDYDLHIATVLHQNKGDGNSRGHIGTELNNKSEAILRVTKDETDSSVSWIEEVFGRGKGFDKFSFYVNENGLPEVVSSGVSDVNLDNTPF